MGSQCVYVQHEVLAEASEKVVHWAHAHLVNHLPAAVEEKRIIEVLKEVNTGTLDPRVGDVTLELRNTRPAL